MDTFSGNKQIVPGDNTIYFSVYTASRNGSIQQQKHLIFSWRKYGERHIILGMLLLSFLSMMGYTSSGHQINI